MTPTDFYGVLKNGYKQAVLTSGSAPEYYFGIDGHLVRMCFAGEALVSSVVPALSHLLVSRPESLPDLDIRIWDSQSSSVDIGPLPWKTDYYKSRGEIDGFRDENCRVSFLQDNGLTSVYNQKEQTAIQWIPRPSLYPSYEKAAPFRAIFQWWLHSRGYQMIHAAAVGTESSAVLLVGKGGSGKSSTAMACLMESMSYLGDDYCLLAMRDQPEVLGLYNSVKLRTDQMDRYAINPAGYRFTPIPDYEKTILSIRDLYPSRMRTRMPVKAVLLPRITHRSTTSFSPAKFSETLQALAVSTIFQLPFTGQSELQLMGDFVKRVKSFWIDLSDSPREIGRTIQHFIDELEE